MRENEHLQAPPARPIRLLHVDDARLHSRLIPHALTAPPSWEFRFTASTSEALAVLDSWFPDVVVTDLFRGEDSGLDLIARLRAMEATREIPIVVVSGAAAMFEPQLRALGVAASISKPYSLPDLRAAVLRAVGRM